MEEFCETKKAYFFGYVVHRLLLVALGRREVGDERADACGQTRIHAWACLTMLLHGACKLNRIAVAVACSFVAPSPFARTCSPLSEPPQEDDRDHYGNKRLDLGGPLLANLFRQLFRWGWVGAAWSGTRQGVPTAAVHTWMQLCGTTLPHDPCGCAHLL